MTSCIDISHWQGFPDFDQVAAAGIKACILKATEGTSYVDPNRAMNDIAANDAGIACCTYHWLKPGSAKQQMQFYLATVDPTEGERVVIDYEEDGCTLDDLHEAVYALLADPRNLQITIYSGHLLKEQLGNDYDDLLSSNTDLWLAQYTTGEPSWPQATYEQWALWQYSEDGELAGITDTNVDLDAYNGTDAELIQWITPTSKPVPPAPPRKSAVFVDVTADDNVEVTVAVNGSVVSAHRRRLLIPRRPDL